MTPFQMRRNTLYALIALNLLLLTVSIIASGVLLRHIEGRVDTSRTQEREQCERINDVRAILRAAFQDPSVLTPTRVRLEDLIR